MDLNFEALMINAFNHPNVVVGGTGGASVSIDSTTFGRTSNLAATETRYGRQIQFRMTVNF
jgi:hypothetical protein